MTHDIRTQIRAEMQAAYPAHAAAVREFYAMQEYHLGWRNRALEVEYADPGKLLRPIITMLCCAMMGGTQATALPLAAGIQLIHDFSLIHDDIQDNSDLRRGRTTLWTIWGLAQGINAGDGMFVVAHLAIQRLRQTGLGAEQVLEILARFDRTILAICEGQYLDISFEGKQTVTEDEYVAMVTRKTAVLLAACCELGALAANASDADALALGEFGLHLGISFQMQDDILGIWGDPTVTGKPDAADLLRRKQSLPVIYALAGEASDGPIHRLYATPAGDDAGLAEAREAIDASGAQAYTAQLAELHYVTACAALARVQVVDGAVQTQLQVLAASLLGRSV
jgi:geranylgeranyl diphosphate synthase, type I